MVSFRTLVTSALALAAPIAAQTASQTVSNLNTLTGQSRALLSPAQAIQPIDIALLTVGQGRYVTVINGLREQVSTITAYVSQMQGSSPITDATEATNVYNAYRTFVQAEQSLFNTLIGKAGLASTAPFIGAPLQAITRALEQAHDAFIFGLIDQIPSRATDLNTLAQSLDQTFQATEDAYEGAVGKRSLRFANREVLIEA